VETLRQERIPVKVLLITGSPPEPLPSGIDGYLPKPCEMDRLLEMVKKLLGA